jgi:ppGpp synthetase/RelA/SpoT-type nucleotidyltranferase
LENRCKEVDFSAREEVSNYPVPPHSKRKVTIAGKAIAIGNETEAEVDLVEQWRASHGYVINTFQIFFKRRVESYGIPAEFAQRLKRKTTVFDKLRRKNPDGSPLIADVTSMHDFAGCRLIFNDLQDLEKFRNKVMLPGGMANVNHKLKHKPEKYDYITRPKTSGYRGIHDVYTHFPRPHRRNDPSSVPWHGLLVEVQYRTRVQHAWATALEISDIIDGQRTKFEVRETERVRFFAIASEILARFHENKFCAFLDLSDGELRDELSRLENELHILQRLSALKEFGGFEKIRRHNVLNIVTTIDNIYYLEVLNFKNASQAIARATALEADATSLNAVYVSAVNRNQLRSAYRNYFNDPVDFVRLVREATGTIP